VGYGVGIDLGTSFTRAAINRGGQSRMVSLRNEALLMPSVVNLRPDGTLVPGDPDHGGSEPDRIGRDFKRQLGDPTPLMLAGHPHSALSLMSATLSSVIDMLTAAEGKPPETVVLTCPAVWGRYRREQFAEVPRRAGLEDVVIITEPEAAAIHYAGRVRLAEGDLVAVYDLGGGTFDTTVARTRGAGVEILGTPEGIEWVGGVDFDAAVYAHVDRAVGGAYSALDPADPAAAIALDRLRAESVRAKEALSRAESTNIAVQLPYRHTQTRITRAEFETMIRPSIEATVAALRRSMESCEVTADDLAGVLLVGGSSKIPLVSRMLSLELGRPVLVDPHPQHCVALGAATVAGGRLERPVAAPRTDRSVLLRRRLVSAAALTAVLVGGGSFALHDRGSGGAGGAGTPDAPVVGATDRPAGPGGAGTAVDPGQPGGPAGPAIPTLPVGAGSVPRSGPRG
jgi:molecular chaperone DnaK